MDETKERLARCFRVVFPALTGPPEAATQETVPEWDSVASITLMNVIEEEFGIQMDFEAVADLTSFELLLEHLKTPAPGGLSG